jgi:hypothetical protein
MSYHEEIQITNQQLEELHLYYSGILEHYQERGVVINRVCYSEMLDDKLKLTIWGICQGWLRKYIV